jgi:hypothetical protein
MSHRSYHSGQFLLKRFQIMPSSSAQQRNPLNPSGFRIYGSDHRKTGLRQTLRSADRARSLARVSQKREYFICGLETIANFALRLFNLGSQRQRDNLQKAQIGGPFPDVAADNLQLSDWLAGAGGFEP